MDRAAGQPTVLDTGDHRDPVRAAVVPVRILGCAHLASGRLRPIRDAVAGLGTAMVSVFLTLTFLAHQTLISVDAVLRTFYRRMVSQGAVAGMGDGCRS